MEECHLLEFQNETLCESTNRQYIDTVARRMGVDAGEIAMIASQGSIRRMSSVSKVCFSRFSKFPSVLHFLLLVNNL